MFHLSTISALKQEMAAVDSYLKEYLSDNLESGVVGDIVRAVGATNGKRLRPKLILMTGRFGPNYPACSDRLCRQGAVVEMTHMASLIHDDIVDDSPLRRGKPTIQSRFGKAMAVYAGDLVLSRVLRLLFLNDMRESALILSRTLEDMCRGEIGQYHCRFRPETTMEEYLSNIYGKTASMFEACCRIGAAEGGCSPEDVQLLGAFGKHLGYAFQLRDDLLDFLSSEANEGKPVHADFKEGILTMPVLYTLHLSDYGDRLTELIRGIRGDRVLPEQVAEMESLVQRAGGVEYTTSLIQAHGLEAEKMLAALPRRDITDFLISKVRWLSAPIAERV
ncbi:MAG: polyprenyl synthetase family protein [Clostridiales bacterium]|nr:polyprenyl synthetase family protein [Clostridiales bacterium]